MNSTALGTSTIPTPADAWEIQRWEATRPRRRMLSGEWKQDLRAYLTRRLGKLRSGDIGPDVETGGNLFASFVAALSTLYTVEPLIAHSDPEAAKRMNALLDDAGYASMMGEVQRMTLGLREMLVHVDVFPTPGADLPCILSLRQVYPDLVVATPDPRRPSVPMSIREAREVVDPITGSCVWTWVEGSRDPNDPRSVIPWVLYHASIGATLWDHHAWQELPDATLSYATARTAEMHNLLFASWSQRTTIDLELASDEVDGKSEIVTAPNTVVSLRSAEGKQGSIGQWTQPYSPAEIAEARSSMEQSSIAMAGIPDAAVLRTNADSRSGVSLQISREGQREAARRYEPTFRRGDLQLLRTIAIMVNGALGETYLPETGWTISYRSQPPTEAEVGAEQDRILGQLERGLLSEVEARSQLTGETKDEAKAALDLIREERMRGSVALTVGAQTTIVDVLARVQSGALTAATARPVLIGVLGMSPVSADEALSGVGPLAPPAGSV